MFNKYISETIESMWSADQEITMQNLKDMMSLVDLNCVTQTRIIMESRLHSAVNIQ